MRHCGVVKEIEREMGSEGECGVRKQCQLCMGLALSGIREGGGAREGLVERFGRRTLGTAKEVRGA